MYKIGKCKVCNQRVHVHKIKHRTVIKSSCEHVSKLKDVYFISKKY